MKVFDKRIYVICPARHDFLNWCRDHRVESNDKQYIHIYNPAQLLGRRINPDDEIDYYNILRFQPEVYKEILNELKMRST